MSPSQPTAARTIGIIIATTGKVDQVSRLLQSLPGQLQVGDRIGLATMAARQEIVEIVNALGLAEQTVVTETGPGAAAARNKAFESLTSPVDRLLFPNDTSWYAPGALEVVRNSDAHAGALQAIDEKGPRISVIHEDMSLNRETVWEVIAWALWIDTSVFKGVSGFDPILGTGAETLWQSGEETDLLLRALSRGMISQFAWMSSAQVHGLSDAGLLDSASRHSKLLRYSRGLGYVLAVHEYTPKRLIKSLAGGLTYGVRHKDPYRAIDGLWVATGRLHGIAAGLIFRTLAPWFLSR